MRRMRLRRWLLPSAIVLCVPLLVAAQQRPRQEANETVTILKPARVFDGDTMHEGWAVRVKGERI